MGILRQIFQRAEPSETYDKETKKRESLVAEIIGLETGIELINIIDRVLSTENQPKKVFSLIASSSATLTAAEEASLMLLDDESNVADRRVDRPSIP